MTAKNKKKQSINITSIVTVAIILVTVFAVIAAVIFSNLYENSYFAEQKFNELARKYYETSLYDKFVEGHKDESLEKAFEKYTQNGFEVKLRQLLNDAFLNDGQNYRTYFETNSYSCDTNNSVVRFIPYAPFGKTDYQMDIKLKCSKN